MCADTHLELENPPEQILQVMCGDNSSSFVAELVSQAPAPVEVARVVPTFLSGQRERERLEYGPMVASALRPVA